MVEVCVVSGYLGAGKTTVIRRWIAGMPDKQRVGVVVNDFGEARIDRALLGDGEVLDIAGSCVCCTAPDGFVAAVGGLLDRVDRVIVEPTGLAHPADLVDTLRRAPYAARIALAPLVVVVDPHALAIGAIPAAVLDQCALADVVVANRLDLATDAERVAFRAWVRGLAPGPLRVVETDHGDVPADAFAWPAGAGPRAPGGVVDAHDHDHDHDHVHDHDHDHHDHGLAVRSWVWPPATVFARGAVVDALAAPGLVRVKGLVRTDEGTVELQRVNDQRHEAPTAWRRDSRLDAFSADPAALDVLDRALGAARLDPGQLARRGLSLDVAGRAVDRAWLAALPGQIDDVGVLVPGRSGRGVRLREVFAGALAHSQGGPALPGPGQRLVVVARDGFAAPPTPVGELLDGVLVHSLGDDALPASQGGPFRLLVPGRTDACGNVKGVVRLALRD